MVEWEDADKHITERVNREKKNEKINRWTKDFFSLFKVNDNKIKNSEIISPPTLLIRVKAVLWNECYNLNM